jgi:hypothetical protein
MLSATRLGMELIEITKSGASAQPVSNLSELAKG